MLGGIIKGSSDLWHQVLKTKVMISCFLSFYFEIILDPQKVVK